MMQGTPVMGNLHFDVIPSGIINLPLVLFLLFLF